MKVFKLLITCCSILFVILSQQVFATECPAVFPDVIATHGKKAKNSQITFGKAAQVKNNPDTELTTEIIYFDSNDFVFTCVSTDCTASNSSAATSKPKFDKSKGKLDIAIADGGSFTFGSGSDNEYRNVNVNIIDPNADPKPVPNFATLNFSDNYDVYHIKNLNLGVNTTLNLMAGKSYFFESFTIQDATTINVMGAGTAIVYIKKELTFPADTQVNSPIKASGDVTKLVMHVDNDVVFKSDVTFSGALYVKKDLTFTSPSFLYGVASGEKVDIQAGSVLSYDAAVFNADFGRVCSSVVSAVNLLANFRFDECSYTGVPGEIIDQQGNYHGISQSNVTTSVDAQIEKALNITKAKQHVQTSIPLPASYSVSTWFKKPTDNTGNRYFILGAMENGGDLFYLDRNNGWRWGVYDGKSTAALNGNYSVNSLDNNWHHMVLVYHLNQTSLYIDGSFIEMLDLAPSGTLQYIGTSFDDVASNAPQGFRAPLDEFIVFDGPITADAISTIYHQQNSGNNYDGSTRDVISCPESVIDHYEIVHDGNGLTCAAEPITIKACTNSDCSSLSSESVSLDFTITSPTAGTVIKASPTFTGSSSFTFNHTSAEKLTLSLAGATVAASHALECSGAGGRCEMTFADAGFRFLYGDTKSEVVGHQTAGHSFEQSLWLQAVKSNNGVCEGLFSGPVAISLAQQNITPDLAFNAGLAFQTNGVNIAKYPSFTDGISLKFDSKSIAEIPSARYFDAGQIRLQAKYNKDNISLIGSSNDFWVKPDSFIITATNGNGALNGSSVASGITHKAGASFDFKVSAVNEAGGFTQNYRQGDGALELKVTRVAPLGSAIDGQFTFAASASRKTSTTAKFEPATLSNFSDDEKGQSVFNGAQYNEVGVINVDVQDKAYGGLLGNEGLVSANDLTIGRFTPAYFKQTVKDEGKLDAYHSDVGLCEIADWAYTGQRTADDKGTIGYSLAPKITITAFNAQGGKTANYTLGAAEGFMRLPASGVEITLPKHDDRQQIVGSVAGNPVGISASMETGTLGPNVNDKGEVVSGQLLYTFSNNDHFSYARDDNSFLPPYLAQIPFLTKQITDQDFISLQSDPMTNEVDIDAIEKLVAKDGVEIRFARMVLAHSYGSENADLRAPLAIEFYDETGFKTHTDDSCLTAAIGAKKAGAKYTGNMSLWDYRLIDIATDAIQVGDTEASISGVFDAGMQTQVLFSPPGKQGALEWEYEVPAWLKFKWDALDANNDGNFYDDNPSAILSFGIYRGNDRIISWREVAN